MTNEIRLSAVDASNQRVLERFWQLHQHDLSESRDSLPSHEGEFKTTRGLGSILDDDHATFLIHLEEGLAGFAIVAGLLDDTRDVAGFLIVRSRRGRRINTEAALRLIATFPGKWQIAFQESTPRPRGCGALSPAPSLDRCTSRSGPAPDKPEEAPDVWISFDTGSRLDAEGH